MPGAPIQWVCEHLTSLDIWISPVDPDSCKVGRFLAKLFPRLQSVSSSWPVWLAFKSRYLSMPVKMSPLGSEYLTRWNLINEYLRGPGRGHDTGTCARCFDWSSLKHVSSQNPGRWGVRSETTGMLVVTSSFLSVLGIRHITWQAPWI